MHSLHEALVNGLFLGFCCMSYSLQQPSNRIAEDDHGELQIQGTPRALHLHDFIRAGSQLMRDKTLCIKRYDEQHGTILERLQHGKEYPWAEILTLNIPKFFSDIVESILGALYIDTRGDLAICEALVQRLGILDVMQHLLDDEVEVMSPKERLGIAAGNAEVKYRTTLVNEEDGKRSWVCQVAVDGEEIALIEGCGSKAEAEAKSALKALQCLASVSKKRKAEGAGGGRDEKAARTPEGDKMEIEDP
jgi:dsRNA-specific ribonuclease